MNPEIEKLKNIIAILKHSENKELRDQLLLKLADLNLQEQLKQTRQLNNGSN